MALDNDQIQRLADEMNSATRAYEKGARINDSMTMAQARMMHLGRIMAEALASAKPRNPKVITAENCFRRDKP